MIASKYRKTYEITFGGTMIAVCTAIPYVLKQVFETIVLMLLSYTSLISERLITLCFLLGASLMLITVAQAEFKKIVAEKDTFKSFLTQNHS